MERWSLVTRDTEFSLIEYSDEVKAALAGNSAIVALESTIISHGLPFPENEKLATELEDIVRAQGRLQPNSLDQS
jgi:pseudouridine-5'-phosphate glycosidase